MARRRRKLSVSGRTRRSRGRTALWVALVALTLVVVIGSLAEINAQSAGYRASINTGYAALASRLVVESNLTGRRLATLVDDAPEFRQHPLAEHGRSDGPVRDPARSRPGGERLHPGGDRGGPVGPPLPHRERERRPGRGDGHSRHGRHPPADGRRPDARDVTVARCRVAVVHHHDDVGRSSAVAGDGVTGDECRRTVVREGRHRVPPVGVTCPQPAHPGPSAPVGLGLLAGRRRRSRHRPPGRFGSQPQRLGTPCTRSTSW